MTTQTTTSETKGGLAAESQTTESPVLREYLREVRPHLPLRESHDILMELESMLRHARSARLVDGADEVHLSQIARHVIEAYRSDGSTRAATGGGLL